MKIYRTKLTEETCQKVSLKYSNFIKSPKLKEKQKVNERDFQCEEGAKKNRKWKLKLFEV